MGKLKQAGLLCAGMLGGILISLQISALAEKEARTSLPIEELRTFAEVFNAIKQGYVEPIEDKKLITHAISGMLSNLDPHSAYLDADAYKDLQVGTQGEFGGLGIEVGMEDGLVKVISPIEDTPADRAGIKSGDLIFKLDDTPVKGGRPYLVCNGQLQDFRAIIADLDWVPGKPVTLSAEAAEALGVGEGATVRLVAL